MKQQLAKLMLLGQAELALKAMTDHKSGVSTGSKAAEVKIVNNPRLTIPHNSLIEQSMFIRSCSQT